MEYDGVTYFFKGGIIINFELYNYNCINFCMAVIVIVAV